VSVAEYREGSILARIEELEKRKNDIEDNDFSRLRHHNIAIIEAELKAWKKIKAMVEVRRDELENPNYREGLGTVHERKRDLWKIDELTRLLGDGEKKG